MYIIDGAATLSSNSTIQSIGTPILGTTFRFNYIANIDLNGYTITIFGETMPSTLADKSHSISATWNGSSWDVTFQASMDENASIPKEAVEENGRVDDAQVAYAAGSERVQGGSKAPRDGMDQDDQTPRRRQEARQIAVS